MQNNALSSPMSLKYVLYSKISNLKTFKEPSQLCHQLLTLYLRLLASANSTTIVELIVELIGELFIVELLYCNYLEFLKV